MVSEITTAFLSTVTAIFGGIGESVLTLFEDLIYNSTDGLSTLAEWMIVFMGVSFALTIFYAIFRKVA